MHRIALLLALVGCSKPADKCTQVVDKSMTVLQERAQLSNVKLGKKERAELISDCKRATSNGRKDNQVECVYAAKDDAGVRDCYMKGYEERLAKFKENEAKSQLTLLGKNAAGLYELNKEFPKGKVGPTPAGPCCAQQIKHCIPSEGMWADPTWQALQFFVDGAFSYQYTYESDGKTFIATATGDLGCTGKPQTHTITGKVGADGKAEVSKL